MMRRARTIAGNKVHLWPERMHGWAACDRCHKFSLAEEK